MGLATTSDTTRGWGCHVAWKEEAWLPFSTSVVTTPGPLKPGSVTLSASPTLRLALSCRPSRRAVTLPARQWGEKEREEVRKAGSGLMGRVTAAMGVTSEETARLTSSTPRGAPRSGHVTRASGSSRKDTTPPAPSVTFSRTVRVSTLPWRTR